MIPENPLFKSNGSRKEPTISSDVEALGTEYVINHMHGQKQYYGMIVLYNTYRLVVYTIRRINHIYGYDHNSFLRN